MRKSIPASRTLFLLISMVLAAPLIAAPSEAMAQRQGPPNCGYPVRNESKPGYQCFGRWQLTTDPHASSCGDGTVARLQLYRCTQWTATGGGTLVNPNAPPVKRAAPPKERRQSVPRGTPRQPPSPTRLN